jgi:uncharacterized protein YcfL
MKKLNFLSLMLVALMISVSFVGCNTDDDEPAPRPEPEVPQVVVDPATAVSGVYTGQLKVNSEIIQDAYVVTVTKISSNVVNVKAKFYSDEEGANYNVKLDGERYSFENATSTGITISVIGKTLTSSFLNGAGSMTVFTGAKD